MRGRPWAQADYDFLENHWGKIPVRDISIKLNRTEYAVRSKALIRGLKLQVKYLKSESEVIPQQPMLMRGVDYHYVLPESDWPLADKFVRFMTKVKKYAAQSGKCPKVDLMKIRDTFNTVEGML